MTLNEIIYKLKEHIGLCHKVMVKENADYNIKSAEFTFNDSNLDRRIGYLSGLIMAIEIIKGPGYVKAIMDKGKNIHQDRFNG